VYEDQGSGDASVKRGRCDEAFGALQAVDSTIDALALEIRALELQGHRDRAAVALEELRLRQEAALTVVHEIGDELLAFWNERLQAAMQRLVPLVAAATEASQEATALSRLAGLPMRTADRIQREGWFVRKGLAEATEAIEEFATAMETTQRGRG
jgi:hypothetical protein